jgi:hypothetical protein
MFEVISMSGAVRAIVITITSCDSQRHTAVYKENWQVEVLLLLFHILLKLRFPVVDAPTEEQGKLKRLHGPKNHHRDSVPGPFIP